MKDVLNFLSQLRDNNNKQWFDTHRAEYKTVQKRIEILTQQLIENISQWDSNIKGLQAKDCLYRINRDIRFSKDKTPYKSHLGIFISKGGKKAGYGGYYFHIEPDQSTKNGHHLLAAGTYMLENKYLKVIREDIYADFNAFYKLLSKAKSYNFDSSNALKQVPKGFVRGTECDKFLVLKDYCLIRSLRQNDLLNGGMLSNKDEDIIANGKLAKYISDEFCPARDFLEFINRAIDFVREQEQQDLEVW
ncbi:MAG: DUF2461 domain-containing protein [Bacteroidales bacterium]|jgi:uncharacterized protein (TIGR02453 family)|nr:DUF2461 domain-containing protein [Bacteroidales bacterium]